jgi:DNA-binding beta-propeller fold protein YncE
MPAPVAARTAHLSRPQWLDVDNLQASGVAVAGDELFVAGDRSSSKKNTVVVFPRTSAGAEVRPLREIALDIEHEDIHDPLKKKTYAAKVCGTAGCEPLDIEDLALDSKLAIYVSVEGERDAVIKFDPASHRAVDFWDHVTGDLGGMGAEGLSVSPDGRLLFVGKQNPPTLSITDIGTGWVSRGPIDVDQINGLAYDPASRQLLVLDGTRDEVVSVGLDGAVHQRYPLGSTAQDDPSGRRYQGHKFDAIAIEPGASVAWLVSDPPHGNPEHPYKPVDGDVPAPYAQVDSMLSRVTFSP